MAGHAGEQEAGVELDLPLLDELVVEFMREEGLAVLVREEGRELAVGEGGRPRDATFTGVASKEGEGGVPHARYLEYLPSLSAARGGSQGGGVGRGV